MNLLRLGPLLLAAVIASPAAAADYPNKTIRVVIPFAAAGVTDIVGRIVFDKVASALGQQIIIDNRPGAGGTIAVDHVAHSEPDGYTFVMADPSGSLSANVVLYPKLNYDPRKDLAPVAQIGVTGAVLLVKNDLPVKTLAEFVAYAKSRPGELTFVSTGNGTPGHLNVERFRRLAGFEALHIPYRVVSQGVTDLVTGRVAFWIAPIPTLLPQIQSGAVRPLAVAGAQRAADLPNVPTVAESGYQFDASTTYAVFAPAGTPSDIIERVYAEIKRALDHEDVQRKLRSAGVEVRPARPEAVKAMIETMVPQWAAVIKGAGIKIENR